MKFAVTLKTRVSKPRWILANFVETTQAAADNALKDYDRMKSKRREVQKNAALTTGAGNEHSYVFRSEKPQRDVFGATILPSNLSFENMKKLSMNQIKLGDIPLMGEDDVAETIAAEKMKKGKRIEDPLPEHSRKGIKAEACVDFPGVDPFESIPGPRIMEKTAEAVKSVTRHMTLAFLFQLLRFGLVRPFHKYGPIVRMPAIMGGRTLLVTRIEYITSILEQDKRHPTSSCLDILEASRLRRHGGASLSDHRGDFDWSEIRRPVDDIFLRDEKRYFDALCESGNLFVGRIRSAKKPDELAGEIDKWSLECLLRIIFRREFGLSDPENPLPKNSDLLKSLREATLSFRLCERGLHAWKFVNTSASSALDAACWNIEEILSQYLRLSQASAANPNEDRKTRPLTLAEGMLLLEGVTKADVLTQLLDTLLIGVNAVSTAFAFLLYHLARSPGDQSEVFREIKNVLPEKYSRMQCEQLGSLKYLRACLKESLRLKMPTPVFSKTLTRDVTVSNFQVPRGTLVLAAPQVDALKEENFPNARQFQPRRWLGLENKHPLAGLSLSTHDRNTFESRLAEVAVMVFAAQMVRNFTIEYASRSLGATTSAISHPNGPLKFHFLERKT